jgi:ferritin
MLSEKMVQRLNEQIGRELESSIIYLQMSSWCAAQGLDGCAGFLRAHSVEEMQHMSKMFEYVLQSGAQAVVPAIKKASHEFGNVLELFESVLKHEEFITSHIHALTEAAMGEKDFGTFNFLQWYVAEQQEEEALFTRIVETAQLIGLEGRGLYMLDRAVAGMRGSEG